jgi:kynureninase
LNGTPHIPALYACQPGLAIVNDIGSRAIREKSLRMTGRLLEGARARGWRVNTAEDPRERAGTVSVECPHALEVSRELLARNVLIDYRPQAGIRISPHFYNRDEECEFALSQIEEILETQAWEKHALAAEQA